MDATRPLIAEQPKFYMIEALCLVTDQFELRAVLSSESEAQQYKAELERIEPSGTVYMQRLTMAQILALVRRDALAEIEKWARAGAVTPAQMTAQLNG